MELRSVIFDCDGVLIDTISSWRIIHEYFGTNSGPMLDQFLKGGISDEDFMADDIRHWKTVQPEIHRDELVRCYQGVSLNPGARQLVEALKERGVYVAIVSAGVDLLIGSIAKMLKVDDWASNGFQYCEDGFLLDDGVVRVPAHHKGEMVEKLCHINGFEPQQVCSVGDNHTDLSMMIPDSRFIGFNPSKEMAFTGFKEAGVPIVEGNDCRELWPHLFPGEQFPN
ncbi:MAG TPA: HAD-IB family phosphatase [Candidatus Thalassarchaeaceae archaeon]|nr:HAD-IB family phosphatase [Candidatus Thalassarchaeaceae archaeon]